MLDEQELRHQVYTATVELGRPPLSAEMASLLDVPQSDVLEGFRALRARRLLFLSDDTGEIVMAPPFAASPTGFLVGAGDKRYFANCVWDAYGIAAALEQDAVVAASCACCGTAMTMQIANGAPVDPEGIAHFAVPAAQWWDDLPFT
jgi:hypothetical protein